MGNLKDDLKSAAGLLKSGENNKVIELLKSYVDDESPDYRALCFAALAHSNISDFPESYRIYKNAVQVDKYNIMAWKGLFKLFEKESLVSPDEFTLQVIDFIEENGEQDKKHEASCVRRRIFVEMKLWSEILNSFEKYNFDSDAQVLRIIVEYHKNTASDQELLKKTFEALNKLSILESDNQLMLAYCKFTNSIAFLLESTSQQSEVIEDEWIKKKLFEHSCEQFFETESFPDSVKFVKIVENSESLLVLNALKEGDVPAALEALDTVTKRYVYPDCLLYVRLFAESENWEDVEKVCTSIRETPTSLGWLARSYFAMGEKGKAKKLGKLKCPEFLVEQLKIHSLCENDEVQKILNENPGNTKMGTILRISKAFFCDEPITPVLQKLAEQMPMETANDHVLAAEVRVSLGLDANPLLVKAAKLNVRCSRAFYLLGKSMTVKNLTKAKSLIERSLIIRPGCEEYVKALNEVLVRQNAPAAERLNVLKSLLEKRRNRQKPFWLADALSSIHLELNNLNEAIDELQQMVRLYKDHKLVWARLADAYTRKGHLRAAVSSYTQLAEMEGGHEFIIPTIRVLIQLREFDEALLKVSELRQKIADENLECCADSPIVLDFTEAEIRLNLHETTNGDVKKAHLKEALRILTRCIDEDGNCKFSSVFKLLGDVLLSISRYAPRILNYFDIEKKWNISTPLDCVTKSAAFYMTVLRSRQNDALCWYDVAVAFLAKFKLEKDAKILPTVEKMLERALSLTNIDSLLSSIWTLLSEAKRLADQPLSHQLHCLARALQLNKANDTAWLSAAILCLEVGMMNHASRLLEQSIKYNPHNGDAWCAWAQHAHLQGMAHDSFAMFRQALCIRPTAAAMVGYSSYLCDNLKKMNSRFESATEALNFEPVMDLKDMFPSSNSSDDDHILFHLGLLGDLFGWYPESLECFQLCQKIPCEVEKERAQIKTAILYPDSQLPLPSRVLPENSRLAGMLSLTTDDNFAFLTGEMQVYGDLYRMLEIREAVTFRDLYMKCVKGISVPLFISGLIINQMDLPIEFIRTLHDALPRHELIDYYPTVLPNGMDDGLRHLEQDGEEPFRYRHRIAKRLLDHLKVLREDVEKQKVLAINEENLEFNNLHLNI